MTGNDNASTVSAPPLESPLEVDDGLKELEKALQEVAKTEHGLLQQLFYDQHFERFSALLMTVVAPDWLPCFSESDKRTLFDQFFTQAPADAALLVLHGHLTEVQPLKEAVLWGDAASVATAVGAETAVRLLVQLFVQPGSSGVQQLASCSLNPPRQLGSLQNHDRAAQLAGTLASLPNKAAVLQSPALQPPRFVPQMMQHLARALHHSSTRQTSTAEEGADAGKSAGPVQGRELPDASMVPAAKAALAGFGGELMARLSKRGYSRELAAALWSLLLSGSAADGTGEAIPTGAEGLAVCRALLGAVEEPHAMERLLEALLWQLAEAAAAGPLEAASMRRELLSQLLAGDLWLRSDVRYALTHKFVQQKTLPLAAMQWLVRQLLASGWQEPQASPEQRGGDQPSTSEPESSTSGRQMEMLLHVTSQLAKVWGDPAVIRDLPTAQQAYLTATLAECLACLAPAELEGHAGLLPAVLGGVSARLDSPATSIRYQAMRVGRAFSAALDPAKPPLFDDQGPLDLLPDERWPGCRLGGVPPPAASAAAGESSAAAADTGQGAAGTPAAGSEQRAQAQARRRQRRAEAAEREAALAAEEEDPDAPAAPGGWHTGSLGEGLDVGGPGEGGGGEEPSSSDVDSDDSLEPYDMPESDDEEDANEPEMQLREAAAALRKPDEWRPLLRALRYLDRLLAAAPDELRLHAGELARSLLHVRVPEWANEEAKEEEARPAVQRSRALLSLLKQQPRIAGGALSQEVYSPHLDMQQRLLILDSLGAAAQEMARVPSTPPLPPRDALPQASSPGSSREVGTSRRWGVRSLQKMAEPKRAAHRNRFPEVALEWAGALLTGAGTPQHGVDLLGCDAFLLGRLLATLAGFVEAAAPAPQTLPLAAALLELLRLPQVHASGQAYVRRAALLAAAQVVSALPPARLAGAMLGGSGGAGDAVLVERLEWVRSWAGEAAVRDSDPHCRLLAQGCCNLHASLAMKAMESLEHADISGMGGGISLAIPALPKVQITNEPLLA